MYNMQEYDIQDKCENAYTVRIVESYIRNEEKRYRIHYIGV